MQFTSRPPLAALAGHVAQLWALSDRPEHAHERIVPNGALALVVNLAEDEFRIDDPVRGLRRLPGIVVSGAYRRSFVVDTRHHTSIVGVQLEPGAAENVLGVPAGELGDVHVALEDLWGAAARELRERLCEASSERERLLLLERALLARFAPRRAHPAAQLARALLGRGSASVASVAARAGVGGRRFHQVVRAQFGLPPKVLDRVVRFQRTLKRALTEQRPDWATLAFEHGYCDQSHLVREFVALAGMAPRALHARRSIEVKEHHVALLGAATSDSSRTRPRAGTKLGHDGNTSLARSSRA